MYFRNLFKKKMMTVIPFLFAVGSAAPSWAARFSGYAPPLQAQPAEYKELPPPGKKCQIDDNFYFTYEFSEKPKMGTVILKVQVFDKAGEQNSSFAVIGRYEMPSMSGAHNSGDQEFKLNKKNDYLLPVNIVMRGEWEVKLTFLEDGTPVFRGFFRFNV
jgi:hypothetical protein